MPDRSSPASLAGLLAVGLGVCCGLPVLASLGVLGAIAGLSMRSWVLVAIGAVGAVIGAWRWWNRRARSQSNDTIPSNAVPIPGRSSAGCAPWERGATPR